MLLVDHAERELADSHPFLNQRMRTEHRLDFAARQPAQNLSARRARDAPGQQRALELEAAAQTRESPVMLLGEQFRRRHHRRLMAAFHSANHRPERNQRLAAAHIAHQHPVHLVWTREIGADLLDRERLRSRQRKRQLRLPSWRSGFWSHRAQLRRGVHCACVQSKAQARKQTAHRMRAPDGRATRRLPTRRSQHPAADREGSAARREPKALVANFFRHRPAN